jgi:flagellar protein FlgJ
MSKLNKTSSEAELREAVKSFESYFVEQVMKEMEKSAKMFNDDDKNDSTSQMLDMHMDSVYQDMASKFVDKVGGRFTDSLVNHMKLTYGIKDDENGTESN